MSLAKDCGGLESLPLKLMIVAIVAALSILPAADALSTLKNRDFLQRAESQLARIAAAAEGLAIFGPGNVRTISVDLSSDGSTRFYQLVMGDVASGSNASALVLELSTGSRMIRTLESPPACMTSSEGGPLKISVPVFQIRMTVTEGEDWLIIVEAS